MADVWSRLGIKPYEADPKKVKLTLEDAPKVEAKPQAQDTSRSIGQIILDTDAQFGQGAGSLVQTFGDLGQLATGNKNSLQSYGQEVKDFYGNLLSPQYKQEGKDVSAAIKAKDGEIAQAVEAIKQYATHPSQLSGAIVGSIPAMAAGGVPGKVLGLGAGALGIGATGVTRASIGGAAAGESVIQGGQTGGEVLRGDLNQAANSDWTPKYSQEEILDRARTAALGSAATTALTYAIPGSTTIEKALLGVENKVGSRAVNTAKGFAGEMGQEGIQGGTGQMSQNYAEDKPLTQGVGEVTATGALIGGIMGGGMGFANSTSSAPQAAPKKPSETINVEEEVKSEAKKQAYTWATQREGEVRQEAAQAKAHVNEMLNNGLDPKSVRATLDNLITPSAADVKLTQLLNEGTILPSNMTGMRIVPLIEDTIQASIDAPELARTNQELESVLKQAGMSKRLTQIITAAYAAKDPQILKDHIQETLDGNTHEFVDHAPIQEAIMQQVAQLDEQHAIQMEAIKQQEEEQKAIETLSNDSESVAVEPKQEEVIFKPAQGKRAVRGELFDLPFGYKGVIVKNQAGDAAELYEYSTGSRLSGYSAGTSWKLDESIAEARNKMERTGEEKLAQHFEEIKNDRGITNTEIVYAKAPTITKEKELVTIESFNRDGIAIEVSGTPIKLSNNINAIITKRDDGWHITESDVGAPLGGGKTRKEAIDAVNNSIQKIGIEKYSTLIEKKRKEYDIFRLPIEEVKQFFNGMDANEKIEFSKSWGSNTPEWWADKNWDDLRSDQHDALKSVYLGHNRNKSDTILDDTKTISKDTKTTLKGVKDEEVQPIRGNDGAGSEDTGSTTVRPDEASNPRGSDAARDGGIDGETKGASNVVGAVRSPKSDIGNSGGDDAVSQGTEPMERYAAPSSDDTNAAGVGIDTVVSSGGEQNLNLEGKDPIILTRGQRRDINYQAKAILEKGAPYSEADKEILRQYTGEGGLVSSKESLTQHYTPYQTIKAIYNALDVAGFAPKTALEPAVGSGNFVGFRPDLAWTTIDIDKTNHEVVNALYPKANNYHNGFEEFKGKGFDLIISNVPFLEERGAGLLKDRKDIKMLHDYYFAAAMDKVNDNGIVAFVTSKGTMDKSDGAIRKEVVSRGDIIGAYRLPSGTFSKNAHTDVVTDVIFIQKRPEGVEPREERARDNEAFVSSTKTADDIYMNTYFQNHTSNILGDVKAGIDKAYGRPAYEITGTPDYSRMKIDYAAYGKENQKDAANETQTIPTNSKEFKQYAQDNAIEYTSHKGSGIVIDGSNVLAQREVEFSDIDQKAYYYEPLTDKGLSDKILALDKIVAAGEANNLEEGTKLIDAYKAAFKTHPKKDKALGKALREAGEDQKVYEYGSLFNDKFIPSDIFREQTRYTGSGKADISESSPLKERLFYSENNEGKLNIRTSKLLDMDEFGDMLKDDNYAYIGEFSVQNKILYYSGNIYDKIDEITKIRDQNLGVKKYDDAISEKLDLQLKALEAILPEPKKVDEIEFKGIEKWISDAGIEIPFKMVKKTEKLRDNGGTKTTEEWQSGYGNIFDNYLNGKQLISAKQDESMASFKNRLREAQQEVATVQDKYRAWLSSKGHTEAFEKAYNKRFNGYVQPDYLAASYLIQDTLDALPKELTLRSNQIQWIMQAYYEGKGINAHDVGGGKTLAGIVLAKVLKDKGAATKPIFVVPSKVIKNWVKEIKRAVPDAKIVDLGSLSKDKRESMLHDLANTNADYVLISKEGFQALKLPLQKEIDYATQLLRENLQNDNLTGRAEQVANEKVERYLAVLRTDNKNKSITIDKLGIDAVFADEARSYKNIGVSSDLVGNKLGKAFSMKENEKTKTVSIDSAMAYDFRFKTRYIAERNNGRNVFLLDATPTPNKPIEIFTMLKHLDNNIFDEYGITTDRDFANMFFEFGIKPTKTGGMDKGLIALKNAFGLKGIMNRYINRISMADFASQKIIDLPEEKVINHYLDQTDEGDIVFTDIAKRMQEAKADKEKRKEIPGIFSNGITASVDPRLYQRMGITDILDPTPDNHKIAKVIDLVLSKRGIDAKSGQIIFLDSAGHTASDTNVKVDKTTGVETVYAATLEQNLHRDMKDKLIASGKYKANEIAILSGQEITDPRTGKETGATGDKAQQLKQDIVDAYDAGQVKVIIGTTKSAGEGMNIQKFTTDIYHIDLPWTIAEVIQRNGRGVRFGNQNASVNLHYFFQAGTFDSLMYKTVMNKKGWNEALWDTKVEDRMEVVDEGGSMPSPAEIMLAMEKDPIKRRQLELEIEYQRLSDEYNNVTDEVKAIERRISTITTEQRDEGNKQRDLEARMKDPTPTLELRELQEKMHKEPKKYKAKFEEVQARVKKSQEGMHAQRVAKMENLKKEEVRRYEALKTARENHTKVAGELRDFEDKYMDNRGNFIAEVECA